MIKIAKQLWYVIKPNDEDNLSYMCPYEHGKDGNPLANVSKMQSTGRSWAKVWTGATDSERVSTDGLEAITDNTPMSGFYVGCSVSRWSTSNKLFRVKDPRGFTVEIPTDNLATLLHHTTVVKGVVQDECVWGRDGGNHILLPVNSEPYLLTLGQMDVLENKLINLKDLKVGDWVNLFEDKAEYYYAGKIRGTWKVRGYNTLYNYWDRNTRHSYSDWTEVQDDKWTDVFLSEYKYSSKGAKYRVCTFSKPKIVEVTKHEPIEVAVGEYSWYCPQRVVNKTNLYASFSNTEKELISVESKK